MSDKVEYWLELAEYDIETAQAMLAAGRYLYVGFMCHQTVEKALKAYFCKVAGRMPPYTHNLELLVQKASLGQVMSDGQRDFLRRIAPMNVDSRYPADRDLLAKALTPEKCRSILDETEAMFVWIRQQLGQ